MALQTNFHVLIIDDCSPDGTASIVRSLMPQYPGRLFLEERQGKLGLGTAYIHGFKWSLEKGYQYIFEMDADFSHNPIDLERLYNFGCSIRGVVINNKDMVIKPQTDDRIDYFFDILSFIKSWYDDQFFQTHA